MPFLAAAVPAIIGGLGAVGSTVASALPSFLNTAGSVLGGIMPSISGFMQGNAAQQAAGAKVNQGENAINNWEQTLSTEKNNMNPFLTLGSSSASQLMDMLQGGQLGPGSLGPVPTAPGPWTGTFTAPTLQDAENTPGYQFTQTEANKGVLQASAAAGGAINGGTLRAIGQVDTGLANTTYNDVFNRAMQTYQTGLQGYQTNLAQYGAQLQGFQTGMAAQNQGFQQLFAPTQLGTSAAGSLNNNLTTGATNIGDLMQWIGNAQASGILGKSAGTGQGLSGIPGGITSILNNIPGLGGGGGGWNDVFQPMSPAGPVYPWQLGGAGTPPFIGGNGGGGLDLNSLLGAIQGPSPLPG